VALGSPSGTFSSTFSTIGLFSADAIVAVATTANELQGKEKGRNPKRRFAVFSRWRTANVRLTQGMN
jgi:hypothetical protein